MVCEMLDTPWCAWNQKRNQQYKLELTEWPGRDVFSDGLPVMGCIRAGEIIPAVQKSKLEMNLAG